MIPVLGGPEEGGVSWIDERDIAAASAEPEARLKRNPQLTKWHVEQILASLAKAAKAATGPLAGLMSIVTAR
jgi:hypothetical protein